MSRLIQDLKGQPTRNMKAIISLSSAPLTLSTAVLNAIRPIKNKSGFSESPVT
jgi:hypothetical protein